MSNTIIVRFEEVMGSDLAVANAARASFDKISDWGGDEHNRYLTDQDAKLIRYLARGYMSAEWNDLIQKFAAETDPAAIEQMLWAFKTKQTHFAPFCHPQMRFRITAPLFIARQAWKSHVGASGGDAGYPAWSEESRRYVDSIPDTFLPDVIRARPEKGIKQGSGDAHPNSAALQGVISAANDYAVEEYLNLIDDNVAPEQARGVLPTNTMVTWVWTGSLMFFARFCWLRQEGHAQAEIQGLANQIAEHGAREFPVSWAALMGGQ